MKTDIKIKNFVNHIMSLRCYDDNLSIIIKLKMIEELNMQIKNNLLLMMNHKVV